MVLGDTTLDALSTIGARVFVAVTRAVDVLVVIDRGEGEPRCDANVEVQVTHKFVVAPIVVVPLQVTEVVRAVAIYPFRVLVGDELPLSIVWAIPREHRVHRRDGVLPILGGLHRTADHRADCEPAEWLVAGLQTEVVALVVKALDSTLLIIVA